MKSISHVDFAWLSEQLSYVVKEIGKGIRPALTLLSGKSHKYNLTYLLPMAVSVELMHTATLVHDDAIDKALSTQSGAILSKAPEESVTVMKEYGDNLGIAFQIVDDILDFTSTEEAMGKPVGSDLTQGTLTLPAMLLMERYPDDNPIERLFETGDRSNVAQAIEMVLNSTIIDECYKTASEYCKRACKNLNLLPDTVSRQALYDLAEYVIKQGT